MQCATCVLIVIGIVMFSVSVVFVILWNGPRKCFVTPKISLTFDLVAAQQLCIPNTEGCSQFYQAGMLVQLFDQIGRRTRYFVEFGARRPRILNSSYFRMNEGWKGLLLDGAPLGDCKNCTGGAQPDAKFLLEVDNDAPVRLRKAFLTVESINQIFAEHNVPDEFDLLTIDVDKNDVWLLQALDTSRFSPRAICIEFSSYFTADEDCVPPYKPDNEWDGYHVTNSSLRAVDRVMRGKSYSYVTHVAGEHAIYVKDSELPPVDVGKDIPFEIPVGWQFLARKIGVRYKPADFECYGLESRDHLRPAESRRAEPHRTDFERDLSTSGERISDLYRALGQEEARAVVEKALKIAQRLARADPQGADYQRDLSVSYGRMGDLHKVLGEGKKARNALRQALEIAVRLAQAEPQRLDLQKDLVVSLWRIADLTEDSGVDHLEQALKILQRLDTTGGLFPEQREWIARFEARLLQSRFKR